MSALSTSHSTLFVVVGRTGSVYLVLQSCIGALLFARSYPRDAVSAVIFAGEDVQRGDAGDNADAASDALLPPCCITVLV